jgi:hypothetical protein
MNGLKECVTNIQQKVQRQVKTSKLLQVKRGTPQNTYVSSNQHPRIEDKTTCYRTFAVKWSFTHTNANLMVDYRFGVCHGSVFNSATELSKTMTTGLIMSKELLVTRMQNISK